MKFRRLLLLVIGLETALAGVTAHGSYVVEADGMGENQGAIATGADFDFVARDFGMEAKDAIQIALDNLGRAANMRGDLLLWSFSRASEPTPQGATDAEILSAEQSGTTGSGTSDNSEDYSYYDEEFTDEAQNSQALIANAVTGDSYPLLTAPGEQVSTGLQSFPPIDSNQIFWILKPTEFTSFSQLTAARFGFDHSQ